ncbi:MAG TPA: IPT/TIG domain-containing protein [Thermoanaerobaculia bacterium]|jgi:hypothetical protein
MTPFKRASVLIALLFSFSVFAQEIPWSITPASGPASGGTIVTIRGPIGSWPYDAVFGSVWASARLIGDHTLEVVTPPHPPGTVNVRLFEYDIWRETPLQFTYTGNLPEEAFERILLPVYVPPTFGAQGAEFRSDLRLAAKTNDVTVWGLVRDCIVLCVEPPDSPVTVSSWMRPEELLFSPNGTPGRFIYVRNEEAHQLVAHLRAFDVSREATNFGTEIPVVRFDSEADTTIVLPALPTDRRFRNNLRVYATEPVVVTITAGDIQGSLQLAAGRSEYEPAQGSWGNFPVDAGLVRVTITAPGTTTKIWAFATVTNNDTQVITTVTPQP